MDVKQYIEVAKTGYNEDEWFRRNANRVGLQIAIAVGARLQKMRLRKKGAPEWVAYAVPMVLSSLSFLRIEDALDHMEASRDRRILDREIRDRIEKAKAAEQERHKRAWGHGE